MKIIRNKRWMEKAMASYSSTLAWKIPWAEEPGGLQSMGSWVKSWTRLSDFTLPFHFHALEKEIAPHSSTLAWRIPGMAEPGRLPSMESHRVGHDWSDLAAAAAEVALHLERGLLSFTGPHKNGRKGQSQGQELRKALKNKSVGKCLLIIYLIRR